MRLNKKAKENPPLWAEDSHFFAGIYKPNSVPSPFLRKSWAIVICLGPALLRDSSDSPSPTFRKVELDTILHRGKYLAVSAGLNRVVSVRNSVSLRKGVTLYLSRLNWSVFGLSSQLHFQHSIILSLNIKQATYYQYNFISNIESGAG